jgi:hypothetical protein
MGLTHFSAGILIGANALLPQAPLTVPETTAPPAAMTAPGNPNVTTTVPHTSDSGPEGTTHLVFAPMDQESTASEVLFWVAIGGMGVAGAIGAEIDHRRKGKQ